MKILCFGDVVGRSGRSAVADHMAKLKKQLRADMVLLNGENAANGFGITRKIADQFLAGGADVLTCGDHVFDQRETASFLGQMPMMLRPANFPEKTPGNGHYVHELESGKKVLCMHLLGQVFIKTVLDCPFKKADDILADYRLGGNVDAILVDFHAEATSEKVAMAHHLDGRVSAVVGSHTHIPTADTQVLPGGTASQADMGMCGDYDSVIGFHKKGPLTSFTKKVRDGRFEPANGEGTMCGAYIVTDDKTGLAKTIEQVRVGGRLSQALPACLAE